MSWRCKVVVLVLLAALVAKPARALVGCMSGMGTSMDCPPHCQTMSHCAPKLSLQAATENQSCCRISAMDPQPYVLPATTETSIAVVIAAFPLVPSPDISYPAAIALFPRTTTVPDEGVQALLCTFLI